jgi:hypothetical protein
VDEKAEHPVKPAITKTAITPELRRIQEFDAAPAAEVPARYRW